MSKDYDEFLKNVEGTDIYKKIKKLENEGIEYLPEGDLSESEFDIDNTELVKSEGE